MVRINPRADAWARRMGDPGAAFVKPGRPSLVARAGHRPKVDAWSWFAQALFACIPDDLSTG
jgi:hypothetical protein